MRRPLLLSLVLALSATVLPTVAASGAGECDDVPQAGPRVCATLDAGRVVLGGLCDQPGVVPADGCGAVRGTTVDPTLVEAYAASDLSVLHRLQRALGTALPLAQAQLLSSHNSYNSTAYLPSVANNDPNQHYALADQLRMEMREIELDVHSWYASTSDVSPAGGLPVLCHATGPHLGCSADRPLFDGLTEIRDWLDANPNDVIMIDVEDHLDGEAGHDAAAAVFESVLGELLYRPEGKAPCAALPLATSFDQIRSAGAQVLLVSSCGSGAAWGQMIYGYGAWNQGRLGAFAAGSCGDDYDRATYDTAWTRYWEDTTWLSAMAGGVGPRLDGETLRAAMACGLSIASLDKLHPDDPRLASLLWSWKPGTAAVDPQPGDEAVIGTDGRFHVRGRDVAATNTQNPPAASPPASSPHQQALLCRRLDGSFEIARVSSDTGDLSVVDQPALLDLLCGDGTLTTPRSAREMQLVRESIARHEAMFGTIRAEISMAYTVTDAGWTAR
jgi:hypothetical protein